MGESIPNTAAAAAELPHPAAAARQAGPK